VTDLPENVTLEWIARHLVEFRDETRAELAAMRTDIRTLRGDMDILIRSVIRLDQTVDAMRADVRELWLGQGDLRRRIEALEEARR
jgi:hypothetical protein